MLRTYHSAEEGAVFKTYAVIRLLDFHELLLMFLEIKGTEGVAALAL